MVVTDIAAGLISSITYDILKKFGTKIEKYSVESEIKKILEEELIEINYSGLVKFVSLPSTYSYIFTYIKFHSFSSLVESHFKEPKLSRETYIKSLVAKNSEYIKNNEYNKIDENFLERFYTKVINLIEANIVSTLPDELLAIPMLINNVFKQLEDVIREYSTTSQTAPSPQYENIKSRYIDVLSDNFKMNFIPGIDTLELSEFYIYPRFSYSFSNNRKNPRIYQSEEVHEINWENIFGVSNLISIIGGPGYGKTLFLKNLILNYKNLTLDNEQSLLPIYCNLKEFVESKKLFKHYSIDDFLLDSMITYTGLDLAELNKDFIRYYLNSGNCLILLDALDEVETSERERLSNLIVSFFENTHKNNKICITTRDRSLIPNTPVILKVNNINKSEIETYLNSMVKIGEFAMNDIEPFIEQCLPLLNEGFLTNFLMVALMVNIYKAYRKLPENKIDLYDKCATYISKEREKDKKVKYDFSLMNTIVDNDVTFENLSNLGKRNNKEVKRSDIVENLTQTFHKRYSDQNQTSYAVNHFLDYCQERTELYVQGSKDNYFKFFHRSFFEYFYAKYLVKNTKGDVAIYNELLKLNNDSEVPELLLAFIKSTHYPRYLKLVDVVLKKASINIDHQRTYQLALDFVVLSDEYGHSEAFYKLFFESGKFDYFNINGNTAKMSELIGRFIEFDGFFTAIKIYYYDEFVTMLISITLGRKFREELILFYSNLSMAMVLHSTDILKKYREEVINISQNCSIEKFAKILEECCIPKRAREDSEDEIEIINWDDEFTPEEITDFYEQFRLLSLEL